MYKYSELLEDIKYFKERGDRIIEIGFTESGYAIPAVIVGDGAPEVLIFGAIHAREHVTANLVSALAKAHRGAPVMFIPMVNIDGVRLSQEGLHFVPFDKHNFLLKTNGISYDFSLWKANINAVDLNVNFNAGWSTGKSNVRFPSPANFIGDYPESEKEVKALTAVTKKYGIKVAICYHAKGEVIYYGYKNGEKHKNLAAKFSKITGYPSMQSKGSAGGYKDWMVLNGGFALTIEVGDDNKSYNGLYADFERILKENSKVPSLACEVLKWI